MSCCLACGCVLELVVCRVRFARVSCPCLRFEGPKGVPLIQIHEMIENEVHVANLYTPCSNP